MTIIDPDNTLKWEPTYHIRRYDNSYKLTNPRLQQLWVSNTDSGEPLSEWRDVELVWEQPK